MVRESPRRAREQQAGNSASQVQTMYMGWVVQALAAVSFILPLLQCPAQYFALRLARSLCIQVSML